MRKWLNKLINEEQGQRKEKILILLLIGILLLVIAVPVENGSEEKGTDELLQASDEREEAILMAKEETQKTKTEILEERLEQILSNVSGIGETRVMLTLKSEGRQIVEKDQSSVSNFQGEHQDEGNLSGQEEHSESTVYQKDAKGNEIPYISESMEPEVAGVLVSAQGAGDAAVVSEITEAVMALFGVEAHKIKVMKME